jgi:recombinational DNA repair protein (RecF pathway)
MIKLQQAAYAANLIEQTTETETPLREIFELTGGFLDWLCQKEPRPDTIIALEIKLLRELGLEPDMDETRLTAGAKKIVGVMLDGSWAEISRIALSPAQAGELRQWLHGFLLFHLGRLPKGRGTVLGVP